MWRSSFNILPKISDLKLRYLERNFWPRRPAICEGHQSPEKRVFVSKDDNSGKGLCGQVGKRNEN
jgi:hypothetical protein